MGVFVKLKSEVFDKFIMFYTMIQTKCNTNIQTLRFDNAFMKQFLFSKGIIHQTTCPNHYEENGVAERKNRLLLEITRDLIPFLRCLTLFGLKPLSHMLILSTEYQQKHLNSKPHYKPYQNLQNLKLIAPFLLVYLKLIEQNLIRVPRSVCCRLWGKTKWAPML